MATLILNPTNNFNSNSAANNGGGGYVAAGGAVNDTGSTYFSNASTAGNGGAVYLEIPAAGQTTPMYTGTSNTYNNNQASAGDGGAIFDATAPPYSFPPVAPTNYPNLVMAASNSFQYNTALVAYTGPAPSLTGTPSIAESASISTGNTVLNNYDINYRANPVTVTKVNNTNGTIAPGGTFNYTVTITNNGNQATSNPFTLTDPLPQYLTLTGTPTSPAGTVTNNGTNTALNLSIAGSILPGNSTTVTIPVTVDPSAPVGTALTANTATVDPGNNNQTAQGTDPNPPLIADPALIVTKTNDTTGPIPPGSNFNYTITIQNTGNVATDNPFTITDTLPPNVALNTAGTITSTAGGVTSSQTGATLDLSIAGSIPPGGTATVMIPATAETSAPVGSLAANTATVDPGAGGQPTPVTEVTPPVIAIPVLTVIKTNDAPATVAPGSTFNYIVTITNTGGLPTSNPFTLTDPLPQYLTFVGPATSPTLGAITNSGTNTSLNLSIVGRIAPNGGTATITIPVTVDANAPMGQLSQNIATVNPGSGGNPAEGTDPSPPIVADPTITVTKTNSVVGPIPPGTNYSYTITIQNTGNVATANPFTIADNLPPNVALNPVGTITSTAGTVTNTGSNTALNLSIAGSIPAGQTATVTIPVTASTAAPAGTLQPNTATVDPGDGGQPTPGTELTPPVIALPVITVTKTNDAPAIVAPGDTFNYTITITNTGGFPTSNPFSITDTLPQYLTFNGTATSSVGVVTNNGSHTALNLSIAGSIAPNQTATVTIPVTVATNAPAGQLTQNAATVNPGNSGNPETGTDPNPPVIAVPGTPALSVTKTNNTTAPIPPGTSYNYTITIQNTGSVATANPITITDTLPANVTLTGTPTSSDGSTVTNSGTNTALNLSVATSLPANSGSITITLPVTASTSAPTGPLPANAATVDPGGGGTPTTGTEVTPPVIAVPVITVTKVNSTTGPIAPGAMFNYIVTIQNTGAMATENPYTLTDTLPANVTLTGTPTSSDGSTVTNSGTNTALNLAIAGSIPAGGGPISITLPVTIGTSAPAGALLPNAATVSPGNGGQPATGTESNPPIIASPSNLTVTKTNNTTAPITPGDSFDYIISITNTSSVATANPITITDTLPQYVTLTGTPTSSGGTVTNSGTNTNLNLSVATSIPAGVNITVVLPVTASTSAPTGSLTSNTVVVDPGGEIPPSTGIETNPPIIANPVLIVAKSNDTVSDIAPGDSFNYIITITNRGTIATANPITITDTLPQYVTLTGIPASAAGPVTNSGTNTDLNLSIATSIPAGGSITVVLPVTASTTAPTGPLTPNTAVADPGGGGQPGTGVETNPPTVSDPIIDVKKTNDTLDEIAPGESFNYVIDITNRGTLATANPITITDTLPQYVTLTGTPSSSDGSAVTNSGTSTDLNLSVATSIPAGNSISITLPVTVGTDAPSGPLAPNTVIVDPGGGGRPEMEIEFRPPIISAPVLEVEKTNDATEIIPPGTSFNYIITITNNGRGPTANPITITDTLPQYVSLTGTPLSSDGSTVTNSGTTTGLNLSVATSIPTGGVMTITLPVTVATDAPSGQLSANTVVADPGRGGIPETGIEPNPPMVGIPILVATKTSSDLSVNPGDSFYYTIQITNTGPVPTSNPFTITDTLPAHIRLTGIPASESGTLVNTGRDQNLVLSAKFAIEPGETVNIFIPVTVSRNAPTGKLQPNVAVIDPGNGGKNVEVIEQNPPIIHCPCPKPSRPSKPCPPKTKPCHCSCSKFCCCHCQCNSWIWC